MSVKTVPVEMTDDDLYALHAVLNGLEAMDELFGENPERRQAYHQLSSLRRRYREANPLPVVTKTAAVSP